MLVSAVADPAIFGPQGIKDKLTKREAVTFLRGILQNGVLLDGPTKELLRESIVQVCRLKVHDRQAVQILLEEIAKQHKKLVVKCGGTLFESFGALGSPQQLAALGNYFKADAVLTISETEQQFKGLLGGACEVVTIEDMTDSVYENTRQTLLNCFKPIDMIPAQALEQLIGRSVKFAGTIRFFDYMMAKSGKSNKNFRAGIHYFVSIWSRWRVLDSTTSLSIELISVAGRQTAAGFLDLTEARSNLSAIIEYLQQFAGVNVRQILKRDDNRIFHTRGLEARGRTFTLDPGFDSFDENGPTRRCMLKLELAAEVQFRECRQLPDL